MRVRAKSRLRWRLGATSGQRLRNKNASVAISDGNSSQTTDEVSLYDILSDIKLLISRGRYPVPKYIFLEWIQVIPGRFYRKQGRGNNVLPDNWKLREFLVWSLDVSSLITFNLAPRRWVYLSLFAIHYMLSIFFRRRKVLKLYFNISFQIKVAFFLWRSFFYFFLSSLVLC